MRIDSVAVKALQAVLVTVIFAALATVVYAPGAAHAQNQAQVVNSCGTPNQGVLPVGVVMPLTQDTTGKTCVNATVSATIGLTTSGGWTPKLLNALSGVTTVKAVAGQLGMLQCFNPNTSQIYVQLLDATAPTLGTTAPVISIPIAPSATGGFTLSLVGVQFVNAVKVAATTTATGSTAPATAPDCNAAFN